MEYGTHVEVPLPPDTVVNRYEDDSGAWFTVVSLRRGTVGPRDSWLAEYPIGTTDTDQVMGDLLYAGYDHNDAQQVVDHLASAGLAI